MDKQIKIRDYLDKDYYIGIKATGDHIQAVENLSRDNETSGTDFPRWGDHCHPAGYFFSKLHLIIPSGQPKAGVNVIRCIWSGDFNVGHRFLQLKCRQLLADTNTRVLWDPTSRGEKGYREEMNSTFPVVTKSQSCGISNSRTVRLGPSIFIILKAPLQLRPEIQL